VISQTKSVLRDPQQLDNAPHRVIYNELLNPEAYKGLSRPTASRLFDDALALFAAGSHTIGTTLMNGAYHIMHNPEIKQRLVDEVRTVWAILDHPPSHEQLEKLPFLVSVFICQS
jgi:cytochrome P450